MGLVARSCHFDVTACAEARRLAQRAERFGTFRPYGASRRASRAGWTREPTKEADLHELLESELHLVDSKGKKMRLRRTQGLQVAKIPTISKGGESGARTGLRPIVIDGSNVAMAHGFEAHGLKVFSAKGIKIWIWIWIPLLPVPGRPQAKVWGSTLPSLLINIQLWGSQKETINLWQLQHHHNHHHQIFTHRFCFAHPQHTGGVHQVPITMLIFLV